MKLTTTLAVAALVFTTGCVNEKDELRAYCAELGKMSPGEPAAERHRKALEQADVSLSNRDLRKLSKASETMSEDAAASAFALYAESLGLERWRCPALEISRLKKQIDDCGTAGKSLDPNCINGAGKKFQVTGVMTGVPNKEAAPEPQGDPPQAGED